MNNSLTLTLSQAANLIRTCGDTNTILLRGQPGIGKSALLGIIARELPDFTTAYIDCATLDLGDIAMPVVNKDTMTTSYAPNARFKTHERRPIILMLDELGKASRPVLNMLLPTILEHRLGDVHLPVGSIVFATTNLDTDGVQDIIPAHAYNRMTVCVMGNPTSETWIQWAAENDVCDEVLNIAREYPQMFECYTDTDDDKSDNPYIFNPLRGNTRAFVSPRSLEKASHLIKQRDTLGDALLPALAGTVGGAAARDMEAMVMLGDSLPRLATVTDSPETAKLPGSASAYFLMAFRLAGRADVSNLDAIMTYVSRWSAFEATMLFVTTLAGNKSKVGMACRCRAFTQLCAKSNVYF